MNKDKESKKNKKEIGENISQTEMDESNILSSEDNNFKQDTEEEYKNSNHESNQTEQSDDDLLENEDQEDGMVDQLNEELESLKDKLLRTMAEMENVRKQSERQRSDLIKYGNQSLARDLIGVLDNLERASNVEAKQENLKALKEGIDLTSKELDNVLEKNGITRIHPLGETFDPNIHQAMFESKNNKYDVGEVSEVIQDGFLLYDRLLRPALVGVVGEEKEKSKSKDEKNKNKK
tara:strand:+ start:1330 stop:2034 length:705 start_codon:yes stop_codon:yes gene_type:complete